MATTLPQRRMAPPGTYNRPPPQACYNCGEVGHYSPSCPHPKRQTGVETRSSKRSKNDERETRKHGRKSKGRKSGGEEKVSSRVDAKSAEQRRTAATPQRPHYDVVEDIGNQQANITFNQLLEDNKTYWKMLMLSLRRPRKPRTVKLPEVYQVEGGDLGPPEIDVEIGGCTICKPLMKRGYEILLGRPWLYGAQVRYDWQRKRLQFPDPRDPSSVITVPWVKILHEGKTQSTSPGYTLAEDNTSTDEESWDVRFVACCSVEEELEDNQPDDD
ncbi:hypothetical protein AXG93_694s1000 [Marchantia polymorpha subsp. ruderalis]|uniref:CCHC-type domain-containing protein n=1 Tax=Marchantia polymorpha subsp. ruderalis TaxID=1480154 RepID=A0A176W1H8_MARPO|nr:hypothetical protein AXG93_694s1000 [Marchantia polymorpha subsp. ruderalis]